MRSTVQQHSLGFEPRSWVSDIHMIRTLPTQPRKGAPWWHWPAPNVISYLLNVITIKELKWWFQVSKALWWAYWIFEYNKINIDFVEIMKLFSFKDMSKKSRLFFIYYLEFESENNFVWRPLVFELCASKHAVRITLLQVIID